MDWAELRHWPGNLSVITPRRGGTEHGFFREGGLWPRSPRNFATEPATWYNLAVKMATIPDDHRWHIASKIDITATGSSQRILGNANSIGFFQSSSGIDYTWRYVYAADGSSRYIPITTSTSSGLIDFLFGQAERPFVSVNGVTSSPDTTNRAVAAYQIVANSSTFNGAFLSSELWDDTTGALVWSYPSESERLRLITTNGNVIAGNQYFEAANPAVAARIDSQIDLRGVVSDYTGAVDFEAVTFTASGGQKQELAGQGASVGGGIAICSLAYYGGTGGAYLQLSQEIAGVRTVLNNTIPVLSGRHIAAGSVTVGVGWTRLKIHLDGQLIKESEYSGNPTGIAQSVFTNYAINDNRYGVYTNFFGKIHAAALFNRALPDSQINMIR